MYRVAVENQFALDHLGIHVAIDGGERLVAKPLTMEMIKADEAAYSLPMLSIPRDLARALFDALGTALGVYSSDARMAAEVLEREQKRVDKMLDWFVTNS